MHSPVEDPLQDAEQSVCVLDPALTMVRCDERLILAAIQITGIHHAQRSVQTIPVRLLGEPNVRIDGQIMKLALRLCSDAPTASDLPDWEWNGAFEPKGVFRDLDSRAVELINPDVGHASCGRNKGSSTYLFRTSELRAVSALLYERLAGETHQLAGVSVTPSYPYRSEIGAACFVCESTLMDVTPSLMQTCPHCPKVKITRMTNPDLVKHMGAHILYDHRVKGSDQPCGFCLSSGGACKIVLRQGRGADKASVIDMAKSSCPNLRKLQIKVASSFSTANPCTNHPLPCPICDAAIWKYNLEQHLERAHPTANKANYTNLYALHTGSGSAESEELYMKAALKAPTRQGRGKEKTSFLVVSTQHSSRRAINIDIDNEGSIHSDENLDDADDVSSASDMEAEEVLARPSDTGIDDPLALPAEPEILDVSLRSGRKRSRRSREDHDEAVEQSTALCNEEGCGEEVDDSDLLVCISPGCTMRYHLTCRGFVTKPAEFFCDDQCRKDSGYVTKRKRTKRK